MSIYYIFTQDGNIYELDATREIAQVSSGKLSEHPLSDLTSASDHYINYNDMFSLEGSISDIKSVSSEAAGRNTYDFITNLQRIKDTKQSFRLVYRKFQEGFSAVQFADGCFFESLIFRQNLQYGHANGFNSFDVSMSIKKTKLASQTVLEILPGELVEDVVVEEPEEAKGGNTEALPNDFKIININPEFGDFYVPGSF